jgi:hypothetical protein
MNHDSVLPAIALAVCYQIPVQRTPVQFALSDTRSSETPVPADLVLPSFVSQPSGGMRVQVDPREALVRGSVDLVRALAAALPYDPADERLVAARVAAAMGRETPRPLTRRLDD